LNKNRLLLGRFHLLEVHNSFHCNSYFLFFLLFSLGVKNSSMPSFPHFQMAICLGHLPWSKHSSSFHFFFLFHFLRVTAHFLNPPLCLDTRGVFQIEVLISIAWGCSSSGPVREINFLFQVSLTYLLHIQSQVALAYLCIFFSGSLWPTFCISNPRSLWPNYAFPFPGRFGLLIACISFPGLFDLLLTLFD